MGILKLNRIRNIILCGLLTSFFFSCESKNSLNKKRQKVEEYCRNKKYINQIDINFLGYSYHEISEISVEISGTQKKKFSFTVSERIVDSIRELSRLIFNVFKTVSNRFFLLVVFIFCCKQEIIINKNYFTY